jgi:hypothetical protein
MREAERERQPTSFGLWRPEEEGSIVGDNQSIRSRVWYRCSGEGQQPAQAVISGKVLLCRGSLVLGIQVKVLGHFLASLREWHLSPHARRAVLMRLDILLRHHRKR